MKNKGSCAVYTNHELTNIRIDYIEIILESIWDISQYKKGDGYMVYINHTLNKSLFPNEAFLDMLGGSKGSTSGNKSGKPSGSKPTCPWTPPGCPIQPDRKTKPEYPPAKHNKK